MSMINRAGTILMAVVGSLLIGTGCAVTPGGGGNELRVGITADYPPVVYQDEGRVSGVEVDLARMLAEEMKRKPVFVENKFEDQIPALLRGDIDLIMTGMSVTPARQVRVRFSEPWLETGLMVMMRKTDVQTYGSLDDIHAAPVTVGFKKGTTGEEYVRAHFPNAQPKAYRVPADATIDLRQKRCDLFVHDAPAVAWLVSENETELTAVFTLLTRESLAWAFPLTQSARVEEANRILAKWKADGTLDEVINWWLPYRQVLERAPSVQTAP